MEIRISIPLKDDVDTMCVKGNARKSLCDNQEFLSESQREKQERLNRETKNRKKNKGTDGSENK